MMVEQEVTAEDGHRISSAEAIKRFVVAGNATFTIVSATTGARFTYRVRAKKSEALYEQLNTDIFFVSLLRGQNNDADYEYMGIVITPKSRLRDADRAGYSYKRGAKSRISADAPSAKAFSWFFENLRRGYVSPTVEFWHEGRCGRCGRKLTVPSSIETGLGPECAEKA